MNYLLDENGNKKVLFHGTNRKFDEHDLKRNRTILNQNYQGDWICYSPEEVIGWRYADAARNQSFDKNDFLEETKSVFRKISQEASDFMIDFTHSMMEGGYEDGWENAIDNYCKKHNIEEDNGGYEEFFKHINKYEKELDFNINDFCDCVENIEYSKKPRPSSFDEAMSLFGNTSSSGVHDDELAMLERIGYDKIIHEPKIIESHIKANKILETKNREKARNAIENGYDLVIYSGQDCVGDVPEYLVASPEQIEIQTKVIRKFDFEEDLDDGYTRTNYIYERHDVKQKKERQEIKKRPKLK